MKPQNIKENLRYQRKLKGLTQNELSEKTTVGVRTIQRIEKGEVQPHLQTVKLLAIGLDIEVNDLIPLENPNEETVEKKWMLLLHAIPLLGFIIPLGNIIFPIFLWIHKSKDNKTYANHGRAIVNFQCSITLYFIISLLLFFPFPGYNFFLTGSIILYSIVISFANILSSINSGNYNYPLSISFLKKK